MLIYNLKTRLPGARFLVAAVLAFIALLPGELKAQDEAIDKPVTVTSDSMEVEEGGKVFIFKGDVIAKEDFTLCSDELVIHYGENEEVREIIATGDVRLLKGDKTAEGEKAVYDRINRTFVITGEAQVWQCSDTVSGEKITVFLDTERSIVEAREGDRVKAVVMPEKDCQESVKSEEDYCRRSGKGL